MRMTPNLLRQIIENSLQLIKLMRRQGIYKMMRACAFAAFMGIGLFFPLSWAQSAENIDIQHVGPPEYTQHGNQSPASQQAAPKQAGETNAGKSRVNQTPAATQAITENKASGNNCAPSDKAEKLSAADNANKPGEPNSSGQKQETQTSNPANTPAAAVNQTGQIPNGGNGQVKGSQAMPSSEAQRPVNTAAYAQENKAPQQAAQAEPVKKIDNGKGQFPLFIQADVNQDHYVTKEELKNFPYLLQTFDKVDAGKDGKLEQHEYLNLKLETKREGEVE